MNYGQALEHLKDFSAGTVFLSGLDGSGPFIVDDVMDDGSGVYLITHEDGPHRGRLTECRELLAALRALDPQPEFTLGLFADGPAGTGPIEAISVADGVLMFEAPAVELHVAVADRAANPGERAPAARPLTVKHDFETAANAALSVPDSGGPSSNVCLHCDQAADAEIHQVPVPRPLSPPAAGVLNVMGLGMFLRVPHDGAFATLIDAGGQGRDPMGPVNHDHVQELKASGLIRKLTRDGEPPVKDRKRGEGCKLGWEEKGLDGAAADFFSLIQ